MTFKNAISWFEIPAVDIDRAQKFYEAVFDMQMIPMDMPDMQMRMFPIEDPMNGIGGTLCKTDGFHKPSTEAGTLVYLNANPDIEVVAARIEPAGGKIVVEPMDIGNDYGFMCVFIDTEGNRVALHAVPKHML